MIMRGRPSQSRRLLSWEIRILISFERSLSSRASKIIIGMDQLGLRMIRISTLDRLGQDVMIKIWWDSSKNIDQVSPKCAVTTRAQTNILPSLTKLGRVDGDDDLDILSTTDRVILDPDQLVPSTDRPPLTSSFIRNTSPSSPCHQHALLLFCPWPLRRHFKSWSSSSSSHSSPDIKM